MSGFFRFPHTPHLAWLGPGAPRDDKVLSPAEAETLLAGEVVVEEKLDGANLGISRGPDLLGVRFQNRGEYLRSPYVGQFRRLSAWIKPREHELLDALTPAMIVFGEWCAAVHSVRYGQLPDWFFVFDVFDRTEERFVSTARRYSWAAKLGLAVVPQVFRGRTTLAELTDLVVTEHSRYGAGPVEGLVIRRESSHWLESRAKLVHPDFVQNMGVHWRRHHIEWNQLGDRFGRRTSQS